jgi:hypothetical protein
MLNVHDKPDQLNRRSPEIIRAAVGTGTSLASMPLATPLQYSQAPRLTPIQTAGTGGIRARIRRVASYGQFEAHQHRHTRR